MTATPNSKPLDEHLKLLHELKILKDIEPGVSFGLVPAFAHLYRSYSKQQKSMTRGLNQAIDKYCPDLSPTENNQVKGTMVTILSQFDPVFCREWVVELALGGHPFQAIRDYCDYIIKHNKVVHDYKK